MIVALIEVCIYCPRVAVYVLNPKQLSNSVLDGNPVEVVCLDCVVSGRHFDVYDHYEEE